MSSARLSALDASFLAAESETAPMHVGWAARFAPPEEGPAPTFEQLREHVERRLGRAPRYRQRLAEVPLGLSDPVWVDDEKFSIDHHLRRAESTDLAEVVDAVMSEPLDAARPLWELWVVEGQEGGGLATVGKVHHCAVDGIAAVDLATILLDPTPEPPPAEPDGWAPRPAPDPGALLARAAREAIEGRARAAAAVPLRLASSPRRLLRLGAEGEQVVRALVDAFRPAPPSSLNLPISRRRHLACRDRPLADLLDIRSRFATSVNDVLLTAAAGGVRRFLLSRGEEPVALKAMVPVSVRGDEPAAALGNRLSFMFLHLPCDVAEPVERLERVCAATIARKRSGRPAGAATVLEAAALAPRPVQQALSRLVASPRTFNLTVSNIPGPPEPLWMLGCLLEAAYPVVPLADCHGISVGMNTVAGRACLGVYADRESVPDAEVLADAIDEEMETLLERAEVRHRGRADFELVH